MDTTTIQEVQRPAKIGERVKYWWQGTAYWGRVVKINRTTYRVTDEKFGTADECSVSKSLCVVVEGV